MRVPVKRAFVSVRDAYGHSRIRIFTHRRQARNSIHTTATCIPIPRAYSPVIERLKALPEVAEALKLDAGAATPLLERSVDIFRSVGPEEYRAVVMLLARAQGMNGDHEKCVSTLTDLQRFVETSEDEADSSSDFVDISFALSKALWNAGRFDEAAILSKAYREASTTSIDQSIPSAACILRSKSFVNLSNVSILMQALLNDGEPDDNKKEFILCEFRDAVSQLHNTIYDASSECYFTPDDRIGLGVAYVASLNNLAVAEVCFDSQSLDSNNSSVSGVSSWLKALAILHSLPEKDRQGEGAEIINDQYMQASDLVKFVKAQIMLNLSSSLLSSAKNADTPKIPHHDEDNVRDSSGYAGDALKILEQLVIKFPLLNASLGRALGLLGANYKLAGSAVTAEGLFQSSLDKLDGTVLKASSPLSILDKCIILMRLGDLYMDWEKREKDAELLLSPPIPYVLLNCPEVGQLLNYPEVG
eukprot:CAMPEP_0116007176 /NCGR_PEP_ID=MMETSP0321-20121206/2143_1 /TAXON_ID=163516 /ORGANISM="Leptocylindrus danicus var. danicus, Strain B650" /LENGTH=473 /DNA_ID=CAMNT_0003475821 /DNA_START=45 /DNA_END=1467 /DNA_ORIENTATION=+